ncbi:MAG: transglutaminase family protein [Kiloniellales bacterium]
MALFEITHRTVYRYAQPVRFGEHRALLRPRVSHDLHLRSMELRVSPRSKIRWVSDVFANSVALIGPEETADTLEVESRLLLERREEERFSVAPRGEVIETYPFLYDDAILPDLGTTQQRHYPDNDGSILTFARRFIQDRIDSAELLARMMCAIRSEIAYRPRYEEGTQHPADTLALASGTCRDFALLMMEAARALGYAARFVTGYLYDAQADGNAPAIRGAGASHAWVQIYLPLSGWVEYDPTNALIGGRDLIRVAVARDPRQAIPLSGSFQGAAGAYQGMEVSVDVHSIGSVDNQDAWRPEPSVCDTISNG